MKSLSLLSKEELLNHAKYLVDEDRKISLQLIDVLRECKKRMLYAELGYGSLWQFAVEHLGLSEGSAQLRISAMRLARENPSVKSSLESGKLSLSNAAQLQSFFQAEKKYGKAYTPETKKEIIESVSGLSKKECERHLFALAPESVPQEKERIISESKTELRLVLDNSVVEKLEKLKDLLAHQFPQATYGELIDYLANQTLDRLEKKKSSVKPSQTINSPRPDEVNKLNQSENSITSNGSAPSKENYQASTTRIYIPKAVKRLIWQRCGGRCEHITPNDNRCKSRHQLQLDHIIPLANHGTNSPENLRYLCRAHNIFEARRKLGSQLMQNYVASLR